MIIDLRITGHSGKYSAESSEVTITYSVISDEWHGAKPGTVLMESIVPKWDGNLWTVTYNFKYKETGWGEKYLDTGLRTSQDEEQTITEEGPPPYYIPTTKKVTVKLKSPIIMAGVGTPVEEPVKLDGSGYIPIRRKTKTQNFIPDPLTDGPSKDPATGETLYWEEGEPELDDNESEIPFDTFPGIDVPLDEYTGEGENRKLAKKNYFWKYLSMPFAELNLPNPYEPTGVLKVESGV